MDWSQDDCTVSVVVTAKTAEVLEKDSIAVDVQDKHLRLKVKTGPWIYFVVKNLSQEVHLDSNGKLRRSIIPAISQSKRNFLQ